MGAKFNKHLAPIKSANTINHFYSLLLLLRSHFCIHTSLMEHPPVIWNMSQMEIIGSKRKRCRRDGGKEGKHLTWFPKGSSRGVMLHYRHNHSGISHSDSYPLSSPLLPPATADHSLIKAVNHRQWLYSIKRFIKCSKGVSLAIKIPLIANLFTKNVNALCHPDGFD